jgi:hypothetical protein
MREIPAGTELAIENGFYRARCSNRRTVKSKLHLIEIYDDAVRLSQGENAKARRACKGDHRFSNRLNAAAVR